MLTNLLITEVFNIMRVPICNALYTDLIDRVHEADNWELHKSSTQFGHCISVIDQAAGNERIGLQAVLNAYMCASNMIKK